MDATDRFAALVDALAGEAGVQPPEAPGGRRFGASALRVDGSIFAMLVQGFLVLKLPRERVDDVVSRGAGSRWDAGQGRPLREWVALAHGEPAGDLVLAREALAFVRSRPRRR